ncbi:TonB-dependent receptor [Pedobacter frigiditerrae]|uniref:TonB-dependent receptor n=1 Tax=Pedobacter frigiditerrae TaxID=2530452 RepID=A0A4R0N3S9_9SPHI|nr:TonB-dependent receptor [Pedobacter frigiditerrae]TCC94529.1 TonB-dependent receptor [Pedobacter frigiditerrae]
MKIKFILVLLFIFSTFSVLAQNAIIKGKITDAFTNQPIFGATISIQGKVNNALTDSLGNYSLSGLLPGVYNLQINFIGYKSKSVFDIAVSNAKSTVLDIALETEVSQLNEVVVQRAKFIKPIETPLSLRTIGSTEIKRNPGGNRDISKVIQSLPGVSAPVSFRNDIIIRGGAPNENRFYIDGVEIPNINHFTTQGSSGGPVGLINVDFIKEVDFYSGAFPAARGNALSSVFEFNQRDGNPDKMGASLTIGSSDFATVVEGPIGKKTTYMASYRLSYLQGLFKLLGLPFLPSYQDFQFKVKTKFDTKNELTILGLGALDKAVLNFNTEKTENNLYTIANFPENKQSNYTIGAVYKNYREKGFSTIVLSRNYLNNKAYKFQDNDESKIETLNYQSTETENKLRVENSSREGKYKINFGVGMETADYTTNSLQVLPGGTEGYISAINFIKYGAFAQVSAPYLADKLNLSFGLRLDGNNFSSKGENPLKTLSPRFSASYNFNEKVSFNFNTGIYYQLPAYTVLGFRNNTGGPLLNQNVNYIQSAQVVAGLEYNTLKNTKFTIEGFFKNYSRYPMVKVFGDVIPLANLGADFGVVGNKPVIGETDGRSYGLEFFAQQRLNKGFYGIFALTLFRSEFKDKLGEYVQSSWNNRYILSMTAGKILPKNWEVGAKFRLGGGSPYTPYDIAYSSLKSNYSIFPQGVQDYDRLNDSRLKGFYQLDVRVDKKYPFKKFNLNVYLDIQNLTYNKYETQSQLVLDRDANGNAQDAPGDATRFKTKLLTNTSGNILPTIGVIFEL